MLDITGGVCIMGGMKRSISVNFVNKKPSVGYACSHFDRLRFRQAWPPGGFLI